MVREEGVEPSCLATLASETSASAIPPPPREWNLVYLRPAFMSIIKELLRGYFADIIPFLKS